MKNKVLLIGNVGKTPEIKTFESGKKLASFSLATHDFYYNDKGDKIEQTDWHSLVAWGKTVDFIEKFIDKGREILIDGKLTSRSYDDKDGNKRFVTEVVVNEVYLMEQKSPKPF